MTTTVTRLRDFAPADYDAVVAASNASYPDYPESVEEVRHRDEAIDPTRFFFKRLVAEEDGVVVGAVTISHRPSRFHPDRYAFDLFVAPAARRRGHGSALYEAAERILRSRSALAATSGVKESMTDGVEFVLKRGWAEVKRDWESRLDVASFDFAKFASADERIAREGIRISTYAAEAARDPETEAKLYDLVQETRADVPSMDPVTEETLPEWRTHWIEAPAILLDAIFIAIDGDGRYLGVSNLEKQLTDPSFIWQGLTGVRRSARGRGIAMALKLRTVEYAKRLGVDHIKTWNDQRNRPMLRINEAMGFVKQPAWIGLEKRFRD